MKSVSRMGEYYETHVKEFIVNIRFDCDNRKSQDYRKVFVRGKCVNISPKILNRYLGRYEAEKSVVHDTNNDICKEMTNEKDLVCELADCKVCCAE